MPAFASYLRTFLSLRGYEVALLQPGRRAARRDETERDP